MTLKQLTDRFETLLKKRKSLLTEEDYTNVNDMPLSIVIIELNKLKFKFTNNHFDKFITRFKDGSSYSYMTDIYYAHTFRKLIIDIMFSKFTPTDKQLTLLFNCYPKALFYDLTLAYDWIDVLVKRDHKFTKEQVIELKQINYDVTKLDMKDKITLEQLEELLKRKIQPGVTTVETIIKKNKLVPNIKCLNNVIEAEHWVDCIIGASRPLYTYQQRNKTTLELLKLLVKYGAKPDNSCVDMCIRKKVTNSKVYYLLIENGAELTVDCVRFLISINSYYLYGQDILYLLNYSKNITIDLMNEFLQGYNVCCLNYFHQREIMKHTPEVVIYQNKQNNPEINVFDYIIKRGYIPNMKTLKIMCGNGTIKEYNTLLKDYHLVPNKECLDASVNILIKSPSLDGSIQCNNIIIQDILNYKIIPDEKTHQHISTNYSVKQSDYIILFNMLVNHNLQVTREVVNCAIQNNKIIPNLNKFDIKYDEELYFTCYKYDKWDIIKDVDLIINIQVLAFRDLCTNKDIGVKEVKDFMIEHNIKPDRYCVENAVDKNNVLAIYFIEDLKCKVPVMCLSRKMGYNALNNMFHKLMDHLYKDLKVDYKYMMKTYDHVDLTNL